MDLSHLCMGCMEVKGDEKPCPFCSWADKSGPVSSLHLAPQTVLTEKYLLGRALGQGGFGITYLAWDLYLDRKLAVKEYFPRELAFREPSSKSVSLYSEDLFEQYNYGLEKFLDEAKTLAIFESHPNIVTVRDFFKANSTAYLVMNYLKGITLCDYLSRKGDKLHFQEAIRIMMPMLDAVTAVHGEGLLHRDISPDNIFITVEGRVILLDFGAARHALGEKGKNLSIILKPGYAPEEQYRSRGNQGPWSDIYAAAATIYRAITGRMPPESLDRLSDDPLIKPSYLGVEISQDVEAILLKALAVKAEDRFQNVADFQGALWDALAEKEGKVTTGRDADQLPLAYPGEASRQLEFTPDHSQTERQLAASAEYVASVSPESYQLESLSPRPIDYASVEIKIGRAPENDLVLSDSTVSRFHARIYYYSGKWYLADLASTHGTYVDGIQVNTDTELVYGNSIRFSQTEIYFDGSCLYAKDNKVLAVLDQLAQKISYKVPSGQDRIGKQAEQGAPASGAKMYYLVAAVLLIVMLSAGLIALNKTGSPTVAPGTAREIPSSAVDFPQNNVIQSLPTQEALQFGTINFLGGIYTGQLKDGLPHGEGILVYESEQTSAGIVKRGERRYEGEWKEGRMHGEGIMFYPDGSRRTGKWENDVFIGR